jgi:hypothetical protein
MICLGISKLLTNYNELASNVSLLFSANRKAFVASLLPVGEDLAMLNREGR